MTSTTTNPSTQNPLQMPFNIGNLASMASMMFAPQTQSTSTSSNNQISSQSQAQNQSTPPVNPFGNLMGIFNSIQQSGSMGELMSMSIGDML